MNITVTYREEKELGYRWVVESKDKYSKSTSCFATEKEAERYILFCHLHNEPV